MALIKSHSNYVLKKKHQDIADGTIYERDITTIGGLNQFSAGQVPIYKSGNFVITVRNDGTASNQYNTSKWEENDSGTTWTLQTVSGLTSKFEDDNDLKIVLKQDYYDFRDFAYYGSLTEMFRASVSDIVARFPGELYGTSDNPIYYTETYVEDGESYTNSKRLGGDDLDLHEVSNPFGINIHSIKLPKDADALKYFAEGGFNNYEIIDANGEVTPITEWEVENTYSEKNEGEGYTRYAVNYNSSSDLTTIETSYDENYYPCKGDEAATILINGSIEIDAYIGDEGVIYYLSNSMSGLHIRPKEPFISEFYNGCDNFQKLLMNRKTTPKYKATFSVIKENEFGYYRELEDFIFPTTYGDYNIDATDYGFNTYTNRMVEIGEYYDENFTDNIWRSLTHEAIKNFDWTYTREYQDGDEEEYVLGGQKMQKALRVFAREFDELISYIDNIKNTNRVTYNERSNIPDYFLTDIVENEGWNVKLIYPFTLTEYYYDNNKNKISIPYTSFTEFGQTTNTENGKLIIREFSQDATQEVYPYSKKHIKDGTENGYFIGCRSCYINDDKIEKITSGDVYSKYSGKYTIIKASANTMFDSCALGGKGVLKDRIKSFTDERSYTFNEVNSEFLRRLKINSKAIWRHKGTVEGIDMILGMFGLRNKKFADKCSKDEFKNNYDYEIIEYSSLTPYIHDPWDAVHQMYRIDWINSTKTINYDNRFVSNYNVYGANENANTYEGIPVAYRDIDDSYIQYGNEFSEQDYTNNSADTSVYRSIENGNKPVNERRLYPYFNKNEQYDGNPYFQMDGGWLSKIIEENYRKKYNFQYDVNNNMVVSNYFYKGGTDESGYTFDNDFIYKETVRNIRRTDSLTTLLEIPTSELWNGVVVYVTAPESNVAIIDGNVFKVLDEYKGDNNVCKYISLIKNNGYIRVGNKFFDESITVYNSEYSENQISLDEKSDGFEVKAYIKNDGSFVCSDVIGGTYSIDDFNYISGTNENETNYYVLDDVNYSNRLANYDENVWTSGWRRLKENDKEYLKLNTIENYYKGNNPHNGNMVYDNGHEYFTYFKRLFKYPIDNDLFDDRCYADYYKSVDDEIFNYGFSGLIEDDENIKQYDDFLIGGDSKIHYFGNYRNKGNADSTMIYGDDYTFADNDLMIGGSPYTESERIESCDSITNQIVNNKRFTIKFYLHQFGDRNAWFKQQEEIKYLDDIVMNYLTQMIPSTTILNIIYSAKYRP